VRSSSTLRRACRSRASNENLPPIVRSHGTIHTVPAAMPSSSRKRSRSCGHIGRSFLIRAIAYRLQEQAFGGLKPSTRRQLARVAEETAGGNSPKKPQSRKAGMGTILVREWQGNSHHVTVLDDGVAFNGKRYRSLSEVAREITGSRWSGPRFFGLSLPAMETNHGMA